MRCLVTGSAGYIGSHLVPALRQQAQEVVGMDRASHPEHGPDTVIEVDLLEADCLRDVLQETDRVYHLAAAKADWGLSDEEYHRDNVEATRRLVRVGCETSVREWVFFSTVAVMGPSEDPLSESAPLNPVHPYGSTKAQAERLFHQLAENVPSARIHIIRPSAVFGPGHPETTNIYRLVEAIRRHRFLMIGNGETRKTTSHLQNLVAATMFLFDRLETGVETYIYVDEPVLTTGELVRWIYELLERKPRPVRLPLGLVRPLALVFDAVAHVTGTNLPITAARIEKFCTSTNFDAGKIREMGFRQPVSNKEALRRTVEWHVSRST